MSAIQVRQFPNAAAANGAAARPSLLVSGQLLSPPTKHTTSQQLSTSHLSLVYRSPQLAIARAKLCSVPNHTMQFVFARRGRRVFQRLNLRHAAALSTRASPAVKEPIRRVSHLSNTRTATVVKKTHYSPIARLSSVNQWARCYATAAAEDKKAVERPKKTGAAAKKSAKPKAKKTKKPKKKVAKPKVKLTEEQRAKKKEARAQEKLKDEIKKAKTESLAKTEPKPSANSAWSLFVKKKFQGYKGDVSSQFSAASAEYKNLPFSEREVCCQLFPKQTDVAWLTCLFI